jgi:hypothetical protein
VAYGSTWTVRDGAAAVAAAKASLDAAAERKLRVEHEIHVLERAQGARLGIGRLVIVLHCVLRLMAWVMQWGNDWSHQATLSQCSEE